MRAEIFEQPAAVAATLDDLLPLAGEIERLGDGLRQVLFIARGSSDNAAVYGQYLCSVRAGRLGVLASPSVATAYRAPVDLSGVLAVAVSQSGRTEEIVATQDWARCVRRAHGGGHERRRLAAGRGGGSGAGHAGGRGAGGAGHQDVHHPARRARRARAGAGRRPRRARRAALRPGRALARAGRRGRRRGARRAAHLRADARGLGARLRVRGGARAGPEAPGGVLRHRARAVVRRPRARPDRGRRRRHAGAADRRRARRRRCSAP